MAILTDWGGHHSSLPAVGTSVHCLPFKELIECTIISQWGYPQK